MQNNVSNDPSTTNSAISQATPPTTEAPTQEKRKRASANKYRQFEEAKLFAQNLNLKSRKEWREYVKGKRTDITAKPDYIPAHPDGIYKTKGWQGWRNWLGTEKPLKDSLN